MGWEDDKTNIAGKEDMVDRYVRRKKEEVYSIYTVQQYRQETLRLCGVKSNAT